MEKYTKKNKNLKFPAAKIIDLEYILENTPEQSINVFSAWDTFKFGSFWSGMELKPELRNLTAAANVILGDPNASQIAQRMVTLKHLVLRQGLEDCSWPEILSFDPHINLGTLTGMTAFTVASFVFLASTICGCFLMYFAVLLLDDQKEEVPDNIMDFVDRSDFQNRSFDDWIMVATLVQSLLFFLLVVSDFSLGHSWCIF
jgi:hypothetical protein